MDRLPAFIPVLTIVLFIVEENTRICEWKEHDPHCLVDPSPWLSLRTKKWLVIDIVIKELTTMVVL